MAIVGGLEAMAHGVAQQVRQRVNYVFYQRPVQFGLSSLHDQIYLLVFPPRDIADQAWEATEQLSHGHHACLHHPLLDFCDHHPQFADHLIEFLRKNSEVSSPTGFEILGQVCQACAVYHQLANQIHQCIHVLDVHSQCAMSRALPSVRGAAPSLNTVLPRVGKPLSAIVCADTPLQWLKRQQVITTVAIICHNRNLRHIRPGLYRVGECINIHVEVHVHMDVGELDIGLLQLLQRRAGSCHLPQPLQLLDDEPRTRQRHTAAFIQRYGDLTSAWFPFGARLHVFRWARGHLIRRGGGFGSSLGIRYGCIILQQREQLAMVGRNLTTYGTSQVFFQCVHTA